jgi:hypothetical protein
MLVAENPAQRSHERGRRQQVAGSAVDLYGSDAPSSRSRARCVPDGVVGDGDSRSLAGRSRYGLTCDCACQGHPSRSSQADSASSIPVTRSTTKAYSGPEVAASDPTVVQCVL